MRSLSDNCPYDEDYFECGIESGKSLYTNYRWIPELTIPLAHVIIEELGISRTDNVLDFGCAKGFLVKAFRLLYVNAYGCDTSRYAIGESPEDVRDRVILVKLDCSVPKSPASDGVWDWVIAKDVLEHFDEVDLPIIVTELSKSCRQLFAIIPLGHEGKFNVPAYDRDVTHKTRESLTRWADLFAANGFNVLWSRYKVDHIKQNWSKWEDGNGFFRLRSRGQR